MNHSPKDLDLLVVASDPKVQTWDEASKLLGRRREHVSRTLRRKPELYKEVEVRREAAISRQYELLAFCEEQSRKAARAFAKFDLSKMDVGTVGSILKLMEELKRVNAEYRNIAGDKQATSQDAKEAYLRAVERGMRIGAYLERRAARSVLGHDGERALAPDEQHLQDVSCDVEASDSGLLGDREGPRP